MCLIHTHANTLQAVEENETAMKAWPADIGLEEDGSGGVVRVRSYLEAIGLLAAHKAGLNPAALTPEIPSIRRLV